MSNTGFRFYGSFYSRFRNTLDFGPLLKVITTLATVSRRFSKHDIYVEPVLEEAMSSIWNVLREALARNCRHLTASKWKWKQIHTATIGTAEEYICLIIWQLSKLEKLHRHNRSSTGLHLNVCEKKCFSFSNSTFCPHSFGKVLRMFRDHILSEGLEQLKPSRSFKKTANSHFALINPFLCKSLWGALITSTPS